jgi:hypothetical protein
MPARCWKRDWVIDLDVASFFDSVDHELIVKAVKAHTDAPWVLLYVTRWLTAPLQPRKFVRVPEIEKLMTSTPSATAWSIAATLSEPKHPPSGAMPQQTL